MKVHRLRTLKLRLNLWPARCIDCTAFGFKCPFSVFKRLLLSAALVSSVALVEAAPLDLEARDNALGSANSFGHARIVRPLGELQIGELTYPLNLVFNTNPADTPGAFGPYWRIPLFASTVVQFNRYKLYWDGPDERRQFFVLDQSYQGRRGEEVFIERGKDWKATVLRDGGILIEALDGSGWAFRYDKGRLQEFKLGDLSDTCRIIWSGRDLPLYVINQSTSRRIFEIEYRASTDPERITIGEKQIEVVMGDGELTAPDGEANYRNYRVSFLRSLQFDTENIETFEYTKGEPRQRKIPVLDRTKEKVPKAVDLKVNHMEFANGANDGASDNWIEWEAKSGFITADSGSSYMVKNNSWDPNMQGGVFDVTPSAVEITRMPEGGQEQRWSYVWNSGVKVYADLATGETRRVTRIMGEGPANGKLRRVEVFVGGRWKLLESFAYDPQGRIVRQSSPGGVLVTRYDGGVRANVIDHDLRKHDVSGNMTSVYSSGVLLGEKFYDESGILRWSKDYGDLITVDFFDGSGVPVLKRAGDVEVVTHALEGEGLEIKITKSQARAADFIQPVVVFNDDGSLKYK